jgi:xanthine dehydrogenase accessory factor
MMDHLAQFLSRLRTQDAVLVRVVSTQGSVPREVGAWMAVFADGALATVGGGRLELDALAHAHRLLAGEAVDASVRYPLGPSLGQCCGGQVVLAFEPVGAVDVARLARQLAPAGVPVALFGAGHVGLALAEVLSRLPVQLLWIDSRDSVFPPELAQSVQCEHSQPVHGAVASLPAHSLVVIMSFSHAEDLDIVSACLQRQRARGDLPFVGLIGSKTKWASFRQRLLARGFTQAELDYVTCPIGVAGIADKRPEVIAVGVAAQLLQVASRTAVPPPSSLAAGLQTDTVAAGSDTASAPKPLFSHAG